MAVIASIAAAGRGNRKALARRWATEMCRGKTGGAYGMNLFDVTGYDNESVASINAFHNARDPGEASYPLNPNLWCAEIMDKLTCLVVHKDDCGTGGGAVGAAWRARFGDVAITPRHILGTGHAFTHAAGTWGPALGITAPTRIRFIDTNGETVDRVQIHQAQAGVGYDLHVAVLDEDLPETVYIPPVAPSTRYNELLNYECVILSQEWQPQSGLYYNSVYASGVTFRAKVPRELSDGISATLVAGGALSVAVVGLAITVTIAPTSTRAQVVAAVNAFPAASALVTAVVGLNPSTDIVTPTATSTMTWTFTTPSDYPILNRQMLWIDTSPGSGWGPNGPAAFRYSAYAGDSGTPKLVRLGDDMVVAGIVSGNSSLQCAPETITWPDLLNSLIAQADANAISLGRMVSPTGYTVTPYSGPIL